MVSQNIVICLLWEISYVSPCAVSLGPPQESFQSSSKLSAQGLNLMTFNFLNPKHKDIAWSSHYFMMTLAYTFGG